MACVGVSVELVTARSVASDRRCSSASQRASSTHRKATVLPEPVGARSTASAGARRAADWIGVGKRRPSCSSRSSSQTGIASGHVVAPAASGAASAINFFSRAASA